MTRKSAIRVGRVYTIDYDDHWSCERIYREDVDGGTCALRTTGVCIHISPKAVVLEHQCVLSDKHRSNKRSDHNGILRSAITRVRDHGPA